MTAKIISFMNQKGGVGKTTLAILTGVALHRRTKLKIGVIDADYQLSIYRHRINEDTNINGFDIIPFDWKKADDSDIPLYRFKDLIEDKEKVYDILIIDTPGRQQGEDIPAIIMVSDNLIIPIVGATLDMDSTVTFLKTIPPIAARLKQKSIDLNVYGVINQYDGTLEYNEVEQLNGLNGLSLFDSKISNLVRYRRLSTVTDIINPKIKSDEFNIYYNEFLKRCKIK
ncbi:MAG: ParA family protein [Rickettsiaceae bacterium]|nr:ParA family protein [Rickettsiaceae bacterium]